MALLNLKVRRAGCSDHRNGAVSILLLHTDGSLVCAQSLLLECRTGASVAVSLTGRVEASRTELFN